jgi:putative ABC transport system permease protein
VLTAFGIGFSVALMSMALGTIDSMNFMMDAIFFRTERQHASLAFAGPRQPPALAEVQRLPGVLVAEPYLGLPADLSHGHRSRQIAIVGKPPETDLSRVLDLGMKPITLPESGLAVGDRVAQLLGVRLGDMVRVEFLDGLRRVADVPVTQIIQSYIGLMVFMDMEALARLSGTGSRLSGVHLSIDPNRLDDLYAAVKDIPAIGAVALQSLTFERFRETMEMNMLMVLIVYLILSAVIAFGIVYNTARIQLSERARELAILRVLGFRRAEVSNVLLTEIAVVLAAAQPIGWFFGWLIGYVVTSSIASDLFRVPFVIQLDTFAISTLVVVAFAALSTLIVRRRVDRLDLIRVLKTRE